MARLYLGFGVTAHWGEPVRDMLLVGASGYRCRGPNREWLERRSVSRIERWYGISRGHDWSLMFMRITARADEIVPSPD